jgi:hypothetical protein
MARLGGPDVAAKIWDTKMGNSFLGSEARWCVFGAIFTRGGFFLSACKSERSLSRPVIERKINPPG